jgi:hypothetical protein
MLVGMKQVARCAVIVAAVTVFAVSCATVPRAQDENRVQSLLDELNTAPVERLVELSARPFLLDGEIVVLERDVATMWTNLRAIDFRFDDATIQELGTVSEDSYLEFADTMDVEVWFDRYTSDDAGLARVRTSHGTFLIVTGEGEERELQIFGFTGPKE